MTVIMGPKTFLIKGGRHDESVKQHSLDPIMDLIKHQVESQPTFSIL